MLYVNCFEDGDALLELEPQGDASIVIRLSPDQEAVLLQMIGTPEESAALARLFLAGAVLCEEVDEPPGSSLTTEKSCSCGRRGPPTTNTAARVAPRGGAE